MRNNINFPASKEVFNIFKQLNNVPRPSWHEEKVANFLCHFAEQHNLEYKRDAHNCVVIKKAATIGYEKATPIVILNHCDMVCVAEKGKTFDPQNDAIKSYEDEGWLKAEGTSLGADNGIGLSMALAVLQDDSIIHGPIEVIATTNEEDGMTGAANLAPDFITGRKVINLDSEDYNTITVGSAGAYLQFSKIPYKRESAPARRNYYKISITGGLGGHSGVDINKGRANANKILCSLLNQMNFIFSLVISEINGGEANNSIAANAEAIIGMSYARSKIFEKSIQDFFYTKKMYYEDIEKALTCTVEKINTPLEIINKEASDKLLRSMDKIPYGPLKMSDSLEDTVETSNSTGMIRTNEQDIFISNYSRSFIDSEVVKLGNLIKDIFDEAGAKTEVIMSAPAWQSDISSPFIQLTEDVFVDVLGFKPCKVAMHFALEGGYFVQKYPGIEIVSIGPKIIEPHSVTERVSVSTINDIWKVFIELLYRLAN